MATSRFRELLADATKRAEDPNHITPYHLRRAASGRDDGYFSDHTVKTTLIKPREFTQGNEGKFYLHPYTGHVAASELASEAPAADPVPSHEDWGTW